MQRIHTTPREGWKERVEADGVLWTTTENGPYWAEAMDKPVCYKLHAAEQILLENAANDVHRRAMECIGWLMEGASELEFEHWMNKFGIPKFMHESIIRSWNEDEWSVYGRFDFIMTDSGPKLLEYNADTPTTLIETAITQWNWFTDNKHDQNAYQFNELHEALIRHWGDMKATNGLEGLKVHFAACEQVDDFATVAYMAETASEAGIDVSVMPIEQMGWNGEEFTDPDENKINACFKLYPWEWMVDEEFGQMVPHADTRWIEAPWKMLLSNKAILALLWERHRDCPYLVPAYLDESSAKYYAEFINANKWVRKPLLSREGCNVKIYDITTGEVTTETEGNYDDSGYVYQQYIEWKPVDGKYPMLGVWMVGDDAVALGIREDDTPVTQNNSRFIPHYVVRD